jgi:hypothetical protein
MMAMARHRPSAVNGKMMYAPQRALLAAVLTACTVGSVKAQEHSVSLFGIRIGALFKATPEYIFVQEDENGIRYLFRHTTNPEYLLQGIQISKRSHRVVSIDGRTATGPSNVCQRTLSETTTQLPDRFPKLKTRIDDVDGTAWYLLSMERTGCFTNVSVGSTALQVPCTASFLLHCERLSNAFVIEASDTELSQLAKDEAASTARTPARNHVD